MPDKLPSIIDSKKKIAKKAGRPPGLYKYKTVEDFQRKWNDYLQDANTIVPRITQFCIYADISKETFESYKLRPDFIDSIQKMLSVCEEALVSMLYDNNRRNIIGPIFALKNCYGWKDKVETENNTKITLDIQMPDNVKKLSK